jgi:hypothetical protein
MIANGSDLKSGLRKNTVYKMSFTEEQKEMQMKIVEMLDVVVGLYEDARACLENYDNRGAERKLDAATKIVDNIIKLARN